MIALNRSRFITLLGTSCVAGCSTGQAPVTPRLLAGSVPGSMRRSKNGFLIIVTATPEQVLSGDIPFKLGSDRTVAMVLAERKARAACPGPDWYASQYGTAVIYQDWFGNRILPDGSVWRTTDLVYLGTSTMTMGYVYGGGNGSQWFAPYAKAAYPEALSVYNRNLQALQVATSSDEIPPQSGGGGGTKFDIVAADPGSPVTVGGGCG